MPKYMLWELAYTKSIFKRLGAWKANNVYAESFYLSGGRWIKIQTFIPSISYESLRAMGARPINKEELALILLDSR